MIPFSKPYLTGKESGYISESFLQNKLSGDGAFTLNCSEWLVKNIKTIIVTIKTTNQEKKVTMKMIYS